MIQRIQTVWLLLAGVAAALSFKLPYYVGTNAKGYQSYKLAGTENFLLMLVTALVAGIALFTIFLFKKRKMQLWMCILGILLEALLIFLYYREVQTFVKGTGTYALTALLQGIVVFFFFMAARGISKDEKTVKESDRLR